MDLVTYTYIPTRLNIPKRPELRNFPVNVLFMSFGKSHGAARTGSAVYVPDLDTYEVQDAVAALKYINLQNPKDYIIITYDRTSKVYWGRKFIGGKLHTTSYGTDWEAFFAHLCLEGITDGEGCSYEPFLGVVATEQL